MNTIVKTIKADQLPDELRKGIDPTHSVRLVIEDLGPSDLEPSRDFIQELDEFRSTRPSSDESMEDAVRRVRELRDEWND